MTEPAFIEPLTLVGDRRKENFDPVDAFNYHVQKGTDFDGQEQVITIRQS
jgi:hypothetical protein